MLKVLIDDSNHDWWYVRHQKNGFGYVPRNFLAHVDSLESEEWGLRISSETQLIIDELIGGMLAR